jgi:hypothetical protein
MMTKAGIKILSRQRFFEVKQVMENYNRDLIGFAEFQELIKPEEAESYEFMFRLAGFNVSEVRFAEYFN